jgi:hypothetical protein
MEVSNSQIVNIEYGRNWSKLKWYIEDKYANYQETLNGNVVYIGIDYLNKKYYHISTNIGYLQKKGEKSYEQYYDEHNTETIYGTTLLKQMTINTKIFLKYPIKEKWIPFLSIGPSIDVLLSTSNDRDRISSVEPNMFGILLGGGISYSISKYQIGLSFDYCKYFGNFAVWDAHPTRTGFAPTEDIKSQTVIAGLNIGYRIK